jgi:antitoxin component of MazEF toxin-antitoxin module
VEKKLTKVGKSLAIILDKTLLGLVGADENTMMKVEIKGKSIILTPQSRKIKPGADNTELY